MSGISHRKGAVSIFIVIFTALLITIVTVSFVRLMMRDQQRASDGDLSKSAYDSAMVGVEDAKRALSRYYALDPATRSGYNLAECNTITRLLTGSTATDEVQVRTSAADDSLNQAYTCVQVHTQTEDYDSAMEADRATLVPLQTPTDRDPVTGVESQRPFDHVRIQWFIETDTTGTPTVPTGSSSELSRVWPANQPPVIEAQVIQTGPSFSLEDFNGRTGDAQNTNTLFLYPKRTSEPIASFNNDLRRTPKTRVVDAGCTNTFSSQYLCAITLRMPVPLDGSAANRSNAYLRIAPRYRGAQVRVTLYNAGSLTASLSNVVRDANLVNFDGVQPRIDSTGRANDLFRRTEVRVEADTNVVYPLSAVDISGSFCKTFSVTDRVGDYVRGDSCAP